MPIGTNTLLGLSLLIVRGTSLRPSLLRICPILMAEVGQGTPTSGSLGELFEPRILTEKLIHRTLGRVFIGRHSTPCGRIPT